MRKEYIFLAIFILIAGCTEQEDKTNFSFNLNATHHMLLTNGVNDIITYNGDIIVDYSGPRDSTIAKAHREGIGYATFLSIVGIENRNDVYPETRALSIDGTPLLEHNIEGWYLHSLTYDRWLDYLKGEIKKSIDKGVDIIVLDDDFFMAQLPVSTQDGIVGDFSDKAMEGFTQYLIERGVVNDSSFDYRNYLTKQGYNEEMIKDILENNFFSGTRKEIPYWNYYQDYMLEVNLNALKELIDYGHNYASTLNKSVYFALYPDLYEYSFFDSDVGADLLTGEIMYAYDSGVAPRGRSVQYVKLGYSQLGRPKCFKFPDADRDIELLRKEDVIITRYAETYANGGCILINPMPMTTDEMGDPMAFLHVDKLDSEPISKTMEFIYNNSQEFQCIPDNKVLVLYSPTSQEMDNYNYKAAFNALTNVLIRANIQFDVSTLNKTDLSKYEAIFAPHLLDNYEAEQLKGIKAEIIYFVVDDTYPIPNAIKENDNVIMLEGEQFLDYYSWIIEGEEFNINKTINYVKESVGIDTIDSPYNVDAYVCKNRIVLVNYNGNPLYNFTIRLPYDIDKAYLISPNSNRIELETNEKEIKVPYIEYMDLIILE